VTRPLVIEGANKVLRCPPDCPNCHDIYVRQEEIEGVTYQLLEVELTSEEREAIALGATLTLSQMGPHWVPLAVAVTGVPNEA
jgi:hypothetical protein